MTDNKQHIKNLKKLKSFHNGSYGADIDRAIKALEQEPKWIPVSERLPEESGEYLVWVESYHEKPYMSIEEIDCDGVLKEWNYYKPNEIVAWCPLPEPYKAESEE